MKFIISFFMLVSCSLFCFAQPSKFALIRPDGTTAIYSSLDAAYNDAITGDAIYLPGGQYYLNSTITKEVHMYGAGIDPDSTSVTNRTIISSYYGVGGSGSTFEGIIFSTPLTVSASNIAFKRCRFYNTINMYNQSNCIIEDCIIYSLTGLHSSILRRNIILTPITYISYCLISNNTFLSCWNLGNLTQSTIDNNIFLCTSPIAGGPTSSYSNTYNNNLKIGANPLSMSISDVENNTIFEVSDSVIFVNYPSGSGFEFNFDYHLKATCIGHNAGTDGTDVGIYGTNHPVPLGWVPSNPHIYFKLVAEESDSNGKLPIHFKVRSGN